MSVEIQCMTEKLIVITIKLDYSKGPSKSTVPTSEHTQCKRLAGIRGYFYSGHDNPILLLYLYK